MKNLKKKGFTIVELVIVIAVVAVLAAVLIPTFVNLTKKANMSADQVAVKNMNTLLAAEFATEKPTELKEVIDMLDKNGYNVDALTPLSKGYVFVWNQADNKIELVEVSAAGETPTLEEGSSFINVQVTTREELISALENGNDVTLSDDIYIDIVRDINIEKGDVTLNLNGHTLSSMQNDNGRSTVIYIRANANFTVENGTLNVRSLQNYGNLTIKSNVTINAVDTNGGGCIKNKTGNVVIEGGTFIVEHCVPYGDGGATVVENDGGTIEINDGTFKSATYLYVVVNLAGTITINNGTFEGHYGCVESKNGDVIINAGTFNYVGDLGHHLFTDKGTITYSSKAIFGGNAFDTYGSNITKK